MSAEEKNKMVEMESQVKSLRKRLESEEFEHSNAEKKIEGIGLKNQELEQQLAESKKELQDAVKMMEDITLEKQRIIDSKEAASKEQIETLEKKIKEGSMVLEQEQKVHSVTA
jgi:chromosome segregation ATPase